jgi:putative acetyltransferase
MRNLCIAIGKKALRIELDDLTRPQVIALISEHLSNMHQWSPPGTVFAFDVSKLRSPDVTFWTVWDDDELAGCGALKELSPTEGEIKSMRTPEACRRRGAGRAILSHVIEVAKDRGYERLSLETGRHEAFLPAQTLYRAFGFEYCGPFGSYGDNGNSIFMTLSLKDPV